MKKVKVFFNSFAAYYRMGLMIPESGAQKLSLFRCGLIFICYFALMLFSKISIDNNVYQDFNMLIFVPFCALLLCKMYTLSVHERLVPMSHRRRVLCSLLFFLMWLLISYAVWLAIVTVFSLLSWQLPDFYIFHGVSCFLFFSVLLYSAGFALLYANLTVKAAKLPVIIASFAVWAGLYAAIFIFGNVLNGENFIDGGVFVAAGRTPLGWVFSALFAVFGIAQIAVGIVLCARRLKPKNY